MDNKKMLYPLLLTLGELQELKELVASNTNAIKGKVNNLYEMAAAQARADAFEQEYKQMTTAFPDAEVYELD